MVLASSLVLPIAAAWLYMSDDQNYTTVPAYWSHINFTNVDYLNVGPLGIQKDGTFGLYNSTKTGPLANRLEWVLKRSRAQNPNIKVVVSQWWGTGTGIWGDNLSALDGSSSAISKYTDSVSTFMKTWSTKSGGIDGYDIDFESENAIQDSVTVLSQVRSKLNTLSKSQNNKKYYVTASPDDTSYLSQAVGSVDFINMQNYDGGYGLQPSDFTSLGFKSNQLLFGICPESGCNTQSVSYAVQSYKNHSLAGIHLWRLNSDNYAYENEQQKDSYNALH